MAEFEATVNDLQTRLTAVQAAIEGNSQASMFKPRPFTGALSEDEYGLIYNIKITTDIVKRCQRLSLNDNELMNLFINGLSSELKSHVVLNQPTTFAEAEKLARLRDAVSKTSGVNAVAASGQTAQEHRIKELEGQVHLLLSLASNKNSPNPPPLNAITGDISHNLSNHSELQIVDYNLHDFMSQHENIVSYFGDGKNEIQQAKTDIIAAIQNAADRNARPPQGQFRPHFSNSGGQRGRNLRTTDGQPICNFCLRVGHVARYCPERSGPHGNQQLRLQPQPQPQPRFQPRPQPRFQQFQEYQQDLNGNGPSQWGN
ncbi:uncharacterized protein LOC135688368 [Rhopilema esculentum]|uniref:uncharacterized protein LOC135688368 n=1 Tax=Rhopilema esculentum TaxID=499914 RepID=UPI0031D33FA0